MTALEARAGTRADGPPHATSALAEADRLMTVCNACRYCEGLCAVFPAMEMRRSFADGDLEYLANLCHACGACFSDCQFAPPHGFDVNVPRVLAQVRGESYQRHAWPTPLRGLFQRNGLAIAVVAALSVALFVVGFVAWHDANALFAAYQGPGAFYRLMPHNAMVALFGAAFVYAILAMALSVAAFWRGMGEPVEARADGAALEALQDAGSLRYLGGGGAGCVHGDARPADRRRIFHHATFYGFLLCFAATTVATIYHYLLGREAPYPWYDVPVVLGTLGGIGLVVGPLGLIAENAKRDPQLQDTARAGMGTAFLVMLLLTALSGLALLVLRATPAMGVLLALHLGVVFALFVTMPYGKFVHSLFRFAALLRYAKERRSLAG